MRLESSLWDALEEIARREGGSVNELCGRIDSRRGEMSLTGAVRAALVSYYRDMLEDVESPNHKECDRVAC